MSEVAMRHHRFCFAFFLLLVVSCGLAQGQKIPSATALAISPPSPSLLGDPVTFTATVSGATGTPTGLVEFWDDGLSLGLKLLSGGQAALTTSALGAGHNMVWARYRGDATYDISVSPTTLFTVVVPNPPRLGNLSTRMQVLAGDDVLIGGFVIGGDASKTVVVRARGPSLAAFGVANPLANPTLQLVRSSDAATLATNDDWGSAPNAASIATSRLAPAHALESAILMTLDPGAYTAIVSGVGGGTGVGIVEIFEVDATTVPLANLASRGRVLTGDDVMIAGFVIQGMEPKTVVVRARGPSLAAVGVAEALRNPKMDLVRSSDSVVVASNDDWQSGPNAAAVAASGLAPSNIFESALLVTLPPGAYTVVVSGAGGATGVGIVEVFAR